MILQTDNSTNELQEIQEGSQKIQRGTPVYKTEPEQEIVVNNVHCASK